MTNHSPSHNSKVVLVIVAHADDETLGAGGTIAKHTLQGDDVFAIAMTDGVSARDHQSDETKLLRKKASLNAAEILTFKWLEQGNFPDNAMDTVSILSVVKFIEAAKNKINPDIIYTHSPADLNIDHRIVSQATLTAFRPQPEETWEEIRAFEVPSATDYGHGDITANFIPNLFISIEDTWQNKVKALSEYKNELRKSPHPRSIEGLENLAKYRGNQVGLKLAEAFQMLRKIKR